MFFHQKDLDKLNAHYRGQSAPFVLLSGPAGVGKTRLVALFLEQQKYFYFRARQALNPLEVLNAENNTHYPHWRSLLEHQNIGPERRVIVFDNLDELVRYDKQFLEQISAFFTDFPQAQIMVIGIASLTSTIEACREAINCNDTLINHKTFKIIQMEPLTYRQLKRLYPEYSASDVVILKGITGGIYQYLDMIKGDLESGLSALFQADNHQVASSVSLLLYQELRELATYNLYLQLLARNITLLNDLHRQTGDERAKISVYLNNLTAIGVVKKDPLQRAQYYIANPLVRFYYRFLYPRESLCFMRDGRQIYLNLVRPFLNEFLEETFKEIVLEYFQFINSLDLLPIKVNKESRYYNKQGSIDLIFANEETNEMIFVNCFYQDHPVGIDAYFILNARALTFNRHEDRHYYYLAAKNGFEPEVHELAAGNKRLRLINLDDIYTTWEN